MYFYHSDDVQLLRAAVCLAPALRAAFLATADAVRLGVEKRGTSAFDSLLTSDQSENGPET